MSACRGGGTARPPRGARKREGVSSQHLEIFHHSTSVPALLTQQDRLFVITVTVYPLRFTAVELAARCPAPLAALGRVCGVPKGGPAGARASRSIPGSPMGGRWWEPARSGSSSPR